MSGKLSDRLAALADTRPRGSAPVTVRLRADLSAGEVRGAVRELGLRIDGAEYLSISGTVHGQLSLGTLGDVAALPEVEWVDLERSAAVEELIDPR